MEKGKPEIPVGKGMEMIALQLKRLFPNLVFKIANKQYHKAAADNEFS